MRSAFIIQWLAISSSMIVYQMYLGNPKAEMMGVSVR